jgi:hypothetical protein
MFYWLTKSKYLTTVVIFLSGFGLFSCEEEKPPAAFYPIDSLISGQARYLSHFNAGLFKEALLSGRSDTLTYIPGDTVVWLSELDIFSKLNVINKPVNKGGYLVDDGLFDPESNLTVKAFTSLRKLPVVYLKVYYQGHISKPRKLEALYAEENLLFKSARHLTMHFHQIEDQTVMTTYSIKGGEKMIFHDSVAFYISGKVIVD